MKKKITIEAELSIESREEQLPTLPGYPGKKALINSPDVPSLRDAKLIKESHFTRLWKYLYEPNKSVELTDHENEIRLRLNNVWQLLTGKVLNDRKCVLAHITWCKDNYMTISERTAYDDVRRAKALYGDPRVNTTIYEKARISSILLDLIEIAKDEKDLDNAQRLIRRYNAVNGLEDDIKTQLPRAAISITFNADPETLEKQAAELMEGVTIDTDFTEE